ncbi:alpha/beta hydrolase [Mycobacterium sp. PS03-16]|uniref:alpha/beta hydrolase n=1 Tax=Mycobacterium sp. PS03-16 TaxID=2559611 RepID=UPI001073E549|nr:alpha/beta hydrolase [Mycobacterium sp. PS03-16]TFV60970.1 alpha/beta hydrolase [Mycobacterium sp. PS03-16]
MERIPLWLSAGAIAAGVSAAALVGAATANADTGAGASGTPSASSGPADSAAPSDNDPDAAPHQDSSLDAEDAEDAEDADPEPENEDAEEKLEPDDVDDTETAPEPGQDPEPPATGDADVTPELSEAPEPDDTAAGAGAEQEPPALIDPVVTQELPAAGQNRRGAARTLGASDREAVSALAAPMPTPQPPAPAPFGFLEQLPPPIRSIGSAAFDLLGIVIRTVTGPPQLPPGSTVTVRSATLKIDGRAVTADWYFPEGDEPPQRMIYLQHGFLANSRMYSYTAAMLAERTNSVVVAPTLSANPFTEDDFWLGGDPMYRAVADLFVGDRAALNASAVKAGYTDHYGVDAVLPTEFVMAGHSLGGGLVVGVAGYYAQAVRTRNEENHLAGVVTLDGVPPRSDIVTTSLAALDQSGAYVPIYELHAPTNYLNSTSTIVDDLAREQSGQFHGVELDRGVHMDSMLGGNPLIQLAAYVVAGFPAPQNPPAAQTLMAGWIDDMFAGRIDPATGACAGDDCAGIYGAPGATVGIQTGKGRATATVLGVSAPTSRGIGAAAVPASLWRPGRDALLLDVA